MEKIIQDFLNKSKLSLREEEIDKIELAAIANIELSFSNLIKEQSEYSENLVNLPNWGLHYSMLERAYKYAISSLTIFLVGQETASEIVSRTVLESSLGLQLIIRNERENLLLSYLRNYTDKERKRVRLWKTLLKDLDADEKRIHEDSISQKEKHISGLETLIIQYSDSIGAASVLPFPNIEGIFHKLGKSIDYRTIYGMMCSQVHSDAGDLLNQFLIKSLVSLGHLDTKFITNLEAEASSFSRFMMHIGLSYFIEVMLVYSDKYSLSESKPTIEYALATQQRICHILAEKQG